MTCHLVPSKTPGTATHQPLLEVVSARLAQRICNSAEAALQHRTPWHFKNSFKKSVYALCFAARTVWDVVVGLKMYICDHAHVSFKF